MGYKCLNCNSRSHVSALYCNGFILSTIIVNTRGNNKQIEVTGILDTGSQCSYIKDYIVLGLYGSIDHFYSYKYILIHLLVKKKLEWDDTLPSEYAYKGIDLFSNLSTLSSINFLRCLR